MGYQQVGRKPGGPGSPRKMPNQMMMGKGPNKMPGGANMFMKNPLEGNLGGAEMQYGNRMQKPKKGDEGYYSNPSNPDGF